MKEAQKAAFCLLGRRGQFRILIYRHKQAPGAPGKGPCRARVDIHREAGIRRPSPSPARAATVDFVTSGDIISNLFQQNLWSGSFSSDRYQKPCPHHPASPLRVSHSEEADSG